MEETRRERDDDDGTHNDNKEHNENRSNNDGKEDRGKGKIE